MRRSALAVVLIAVTVLSGCGNTPKTTVVLIDGTASIDPAEYDRCRLEIERIIQSMGRGDHVMLVTITGEPEELLGHRIIHILMPTEYVPYDTNLKKARAEAAKRIAQFFAELPTIHAKRTDVVATLRVAASFSSRAHTQLVIFSDMVAADGDLQFTTAPELANVKSAEALAERVARKNMLAGVDVRIGILKSFDLERMNSSRREAIQAFWKRWFNVSGASKVKISVDLETLGE
jgi:hypothetical protein